MATKTSNQNNKNPKVCVENNCFYVEIADDSIERSGGLMYRTELGAKEGMIFLFESEEEYGFWMKNTLIPLDIIFIDSNLTITEIYKNVMPCKQINCPSYNGKGKYVLEINSGKAEELGIGKGDLVFFHNII